MSGLLLHCHNIRGIPEPVAGVGHVIARRPEVASPDFPTSYPTYEQFRRRERSGRNLLPVGVTDSSGRQLRSRVFQPISGPQHGERHGPSTFENDMTYLLPLLAIVAAFSVYARDRISGVLESTVVQPVTRQGLATARFLAVVIVLLSGLGTGMALSDELDYLAVGYYLLPSYFVSFYLGFAIALVFFVGIVFLMSHVLRSTAALLAIGMGLYLWFSFFWGTTITSFEASSRGYYVGTQSATGLQVNLDFFNPIQYPALFLSGITNTTPFAAAQYGGTAASWGITPIALGLSALMWTLIPALLLVWRIRTSD